MMVWLALALVAAPGAATVDVRILRSHHPRQIAVAGHVVAPDGSAVRVDGAAREAFALPAGIWSLEIDGMGPGAVRTYEGALTLRARGDELEVRLQAPLESYVAGVVAAESVAGTPGPALEALAIVVRSHALASPAGTLDDLADCQVFHGVPAGALGEAARAAAQATAGLVLRLGGEHGAIAMATFGASCGGHTADPREVFGGAERTGARAVPDLDAPEPWRARLSGAVWREAARQAFADPFLSAEPVLIWGGDGRLVQLAEKGPAGTRRVAGDLFVRRLNRLLGLGTVPSARFEVHENGEDVVLGGWGHGHGVGLCQAGAALRARRGDDDLAILRAYFPEAAVGPAD